MTDDQAYFWTEEWQAGEREADEDIAAGRVETFDTMDELIADLTVPDRPDWLTYPYRPKRYDSTKRSESAKKRLKKRREKKGK